MSRLVHVVQDQGERMSNTKQNPVLALQEQPGMTPAQQIAAAIHSPKFSNALVAWRFSRCSEQHGVNETADMMGTALHKVRQDDLSEVGDLLMAQAMTLNTLFCRMADSAANNLGEHLGATETYMRLALKSQAQCARTLEVLGNLKNPLQGAFVRQANIGNAVQVNNGQQNLTSTRTRAQAHGENPKSANELLEAENGERLDTRATAVAGTTDTHMATVGEIHRTGKRGRKGT